jgi:uncharacterized oligopeptide transporter (OPT) family protein
MARYDVAVAKDDPYPTGTPAVTVLNNCRTQQEQQTAANWIAQQILNLAAGGMVAGGAKSP